MCSMVKKDRIPTLNLVPHPKETWHLPVAEDTGGLQLGRYCDRMGDGASWMEGMLSLRGHVMWLIMCSGLRGGWMFGVCTHTCLVPSYLTQLCWQLFFAFTSCCSGRKTSISKCQIPLIFQLFPNISVILEQIHIHRPSVMAGLAIPDWLLSFPCWFRLDQEDWVSAGLREHAAFPQHPPGDLRRGCVLHPDHHRAADQLYREGLRPGDLLWEIPSEIMWYVFCSWDCFLINCF